MPRVVENLNPKLLNLIAEEMAIEEAELTADASFGEDLDVDEIDVAELLMLAETRLGAEEFNEGEWEDCRTVGDYLRLVAEHVGAGAKKIGKKK